MTRSLEWQREHPEAVREHRRRYYQKNKARLNAAHRSYSLRRSFGLTDEQFYNMAEIQDHRCAVCASPTPDGRGTWHVDHDHACCPGRTSCGQCIRGLLCSRCNGQVLPVIEGPLYERALRYLQRKEARV